MKNLLLIFASTFVTSFALADHVPVEWSLPNKGKDCSLQSSYIESWDCGKDAYQVWSCLSAGATSSNYLVVGQITSDVANDCSPGISVVKVVNQSK